MAKRNKAICVLLENFLTKCSTVHVLMLTLSLLHLISQCKSGDTSRRFTAEQCMETIKILITL